MSTLIIKNRQFPIEEYEMVESKNSFGGNTTTYLINIKKDGYIISQLEEFLDTEEFYKVNINDTDDNSIYGYSTEHYKFDGIEEKDNILTIKYVYTYIPTSISIESLNAKIDYIAIMSDISIDQEE